MREGGYRHIQAATLIRWIGFLLPVALLLFAWILTLKHSYVSTSFMAILVCWALIGFLQLLFPIRRKRIIVENVSQSVNGFEHDRTSTILNNLTDAILSTDAKGIIRLYNAATLNLLDTNGSLEGQHIDDVLPLKDQNGVAVTMSQAFEAAKSAVTRDDLEFTFTDGEAMRLELIYAPIRSSFSSIKQAEAHEGYVLIMRDVTKAKSLEEERDEFISVVSHELRTPVTIMEGSLSNLQLMLAKKGAALTKTHTLNAVKMAHDQVLYLAKMINDLSTLSRAERGIADTPEEINVEELMHKMHNAYHHEARQKKLHLNLDLGAHLGSVIASRLYLEELLQNFITNALKYTHDGTITISAHAANSKVTFKVKDSGIGISKLDQAKIFEKFYRSEDYRTRETSGTGLGLYVAAKLAKKLGTKIQLESRLNHGSTFWFELPVK